MSRFSPKTVSQMLTAAGMDPAEWDLAELAEVLEGQWSQMESVLGHLEQSDEPALVFDPKWE